MLDYSAFHSLLFPFHAAEFLDHFRTQFIAEVDASTIVLELEHRGIISDGDQKTIRQEVNATLQAQLLHVCLKKKCDAKALTNVCDIIAMVKGNPRMKSFGEYMKAEWEKSMCCHSVCVCACDECVNVHMCVCFVSFLWIVLSCSASQKSNGQDPPTGPQSGDSP